MTPASSRPTPQREDEQREPARLEPAGPRAGGDAVLHEIEEGLDPTSTWVVVFPDHAGAGGPAAESCLCVSDGRFGTRGRLEEDGVAPVPGVLAAGLYDQDMRGGEHLVGAPSWTALPLHRELPPGTRTLDLRTGTVARRLERDGRVVFRSARWACLARPGTAVLVAEADAEVLPGHDELARRTSVLGRTSQGGGVGVSVGTSAQSVVAADRVAVDRVAAYATGRRPLRASSEAASLLSSARSVGIAALRNEQRAAWDVRWDEADVEVVGAEETTRAIRFALFHLMGSAVDQGEAAVGARGVTGSGYDGHVFWDADVFVLPFLAATHPRAARAMLEYRIRRLPPARRAAAETGRRGARFPWESAGTGADVTPRTGVDPEGRRVAIATGEREEHITADVAWAAWQFATWTGRWRFLDGAGLGLVRESARYWADRIEVDAAGRGHIDHVIGPDEYHDDVDDNAFTNQMAAWNLRRGAELLERRGADRSGDPSGGAGPLEAAGDGPGTDDPERWRSLADAVVDGFDPETGRHEQCAGFDGLTPAFAEDLVTAGTGPGPVPASLLPDPDALARTQLVKQADVLMLHHMLPGDVRPGTLAADVDHYLPRTVHGSSLSLPVHAGLLARLGRPDAAAAMLDVAARTDLDDLTGATAGGLHLATLGGIWQAVVLGSAGVRVARPDDDALSVDPHLPAHWEELRIRLRWHGRPIRLRCTSERVHVACDRPVRVRLGTEPAVVVEPPGRWIERSG